MGAAHCCDMLMLGSKPGSQHRDHEITTAYVRAPEVWYGAAVSKAADIWALGVQALALTTQALPWLFADDAGVLPAIIDLLPAPRWAEWLQARGRMPRYSTP